MAAVGDPLLNDHPAEARGNPTEVFAAALRLGLTSFGGPIAHLGYFERRYVQQLQWLTGPEYGSIVSVCQLLPGPTSSQVGFLIGLRRAGWSGALAAWCGFTLPSAALMFCFAVFAPAAPGPRVQAVLHGLMLTAVVVVGQAVWSMARTLCPDTARRLIAIGACVLLLFEHTGLTQLIALVGGAVAGSLSCRTATAALDTRLTVARQNTAVAWIALVAFLSLLATLPLIALWSPHSLEALAAVFYRAGALVFGGGHVVLPLLQQALVPDHWISDDRFLAGYGLAQAMPGPLFTVSAFLGAASAPAHVALLWALVALAAIFLPGLLLAIAGLSLWSRLAALQLTQPALAGTNAAVVGVLAAALYNPVWTTGVQSLVDVVVVIAAFLLLQWGKTPPIMVTGLCVLVSVARVA